MIIFSIIFVCIILIFVAAESGYPLSFLVKNNEEAANSYDTPLVGMSWEDFNKRIIQESCSWIVISGKVYDIRNWMTSHPGGKLILEQFVGTDATSAFFGTVIQAPSHYRHTGDLAINIEGNQDLKKNQKAILLYKKHSIVGLKEAKSMIIGQIQDYKKLPTDKYKIKGTSTSQLSLPTNVRSNSMLEHLDDIFRANIKKTIFSSHEINKKGALNFGIMTTHFQVLHLISKTLVVSEKAKMPVYRFRFAFDNPTATIQCIPGDSFELMVRREKQKKDVEKEDRLSKKEWKVICRKYTPFKLFSTGYIDLVVKVYPRGKLTSVLDNIRIGERVRVMGPVISSNPFNTNANHGCYKRVVFIAAGTGITPMMLLYDFYRHILEDKQFEDKNDPFYPKKILLLTVNYSINVFRYYS